MPKWKQHFAKKFKLYHLSEKNLDGVELEPRSMSKDRAMECENIRTKRICVSTSIVGALQGIGYSDYDCIGKILYVHEPDNLDWLFEHDKIYKPNTKQVPDCDVTGEHWLKSKSRMKLVGKIKITNLVDGTGNENLSYMIDDYKTWCDDFEWEWTA